MSGADRDPIFEGLDRLAGLADREVAGDRMPDIRRRVRVARQRRVAGVGFAAVVLATVGFGVWQGLPSDDQKPEPLPSPYRQSLTVDVTPQYSDQIRLRVTVEGTATAWSGPTAGAAVPTGVQGFRVVVDGDVVKDTIRTELSCEKGGAPADFAETYPARKNGLAISVSGAGAHQVEVHAPYCSDGTLVDEPWTGTVRTQVGPPVVVDEQVVDLDGDGADETVQVVRPAVGEQGTWTLQVQPAADDPVVVDLPDTSEWGLAAVRDLDGDGTLEVVVEGGGGETALWQVYGYAGHALTPVPTHNQSGADEPLAYAASEGLPQDETWRIALVDQGFVSYRTLEPFPSPPATLEVRRWVDDGSDLVLQDATEPGCWHEDLSVTLGPC